jgi:hypothetical protein
MKYRKKPVVVEAFQLGIDDAPEWFADAMRNGNTIILKRDLEGRPCAEIITLEGTMDARYADYVIRGVKGVIYPCKPNIFRMTYERVEEE